MHIRTCILPLRLWLVQKRVVVHCGDAISRRRARQPGENLCVCVALSFLPTAERHQVQAHWTIAGFGTIAAVTLGAAGDVVALSLNYI